MSDKENPLGYEGEFIPSRYEGTPCFPYTTPEGLTWKAKHEHSYEPPPEYMRGIYPRDEDMRPDQFRHYNGREHFYRTIR